MALSTSACVIARPVVLPARRPPRGSGWVRARSRWWSAQHGSTLPRPLAHSATPFEIGHHIGGIEASVLSVHGLGAETDVVGGRQRSRRPVSPPPGRRQARRARPQPGPDGQSQQGPAHAARRYAQRHGRHPVTATRRRRRSPASPPRRHRSAGRRLPACWPRCGTRPRTADGPGPTAPPGRRRRRAYRSRAPPTR